jgi:predicted dehydrogenase
MNKVRLGIIGLGNIGKFHAGYLAEGKVSRGELVAVGTTSAESREKYKSLKVFSDGETLIKSGAVDAVIIATPHYQHPALGIAALDAGVHVLVEKPISQHKADAGKLIAAHQRNPKLVFAVILQMRTEPRYQIIREMVQSGELGEIVRINWITTDWFRTEAYYNSSEWRATWRGEGGGVLINQCLHNLDVLQWICGLPRRVRGFCQLGRFHEIEVEDSVTAYLEWANGATGMFISSSGEAPGTNRLEIVGSRGTLVLEKNELSVTRNETDMLQFSKTAKAGFAKPDATNLKIPFENAESPLVRVTQNFVNAILDGEPLIAPGEEGVNSVELANAMVYSSLLGQTIELPMDGAAWERKLNELIAQSKMVKKVVKGVADDVASSFRK